MLATLPKRKRPKKRWDKPVSPKSHSDLYGFLESASQTLFLYTEHADNMDFPLRDENVSVHSVLAVYENHQA